MFSCHSLHECCMSVRLFVCPSVQNELVTEEYNTTKVQIWYTFSMPILPTYFFFRCHLDQAQQSMSSGFSKQIACGTQDMQCRFKRKLETKASSHEGQCIPAGYCHAHMLLYVSGVNYNVNGKYTKYFAQLCVRIFTFWNISTTH